MICFTVRRNTFCSYFIIIEMLIMSSELVICAGSPAIIL
nr:MAG TPA: hypothetical protein [Caudoviricetes sp.]